MPINGFILLAGLCLAVILFVLLYTRIENFFVFYPQKTLESTPADWSLSHETVTFDTLDRKKLHGWFFPGQGSGPVLLFFHGNAGNMSHRLDNVKRLLDHGLRVLIFDYRGYGRSEGKPSERGIYLDGAAAFDFLVNVKGISPHDIVLFGRSLGAAVAIEVALRRKARALIVESAFTSTREMARSLFLFAPISPLLPAHYHNVGKISRVRVPLMFIHGTDDDIVPYRMGRKLHETATAPKRFLSLEGAGHNDTYVVGGEMYFQALRDFIFGDAAPAR